MSSKKRKAQGKKVKASLVFGIIMVLLALGMFVVEITTFIKSGMQLNMQVYLYAGSVIVLLFGAGVVLAPYLNHMKEVRGKRLKERGLS